MNWYRINMSFEGSKVAQSLLLYTAVIHPLFYSTVCLKVEFKRAIPTISCHHLLHLSKREVPIFLIQILTVEHCVYIDVFITIIALVQGVRLFKNKLSKKSKEVRIIPLNGPDETHVKSVNGHFKRS